MARPGEPIARERIEHAACTSKTNVAAAQALGMNPRSFCRLCVTYGIETPLARAERLLWDVWEGGSPPPSAGGSACTS
jgi:hypothetical protein